MIGIKFLTRFKCLTYKHTLPRRHNQQSAILSPEPMRNHSLKQCGKKVHVRVQKLLGMWSFLEGRIFFPSFVYGQRTVGLFKRQGLVLSVAHTDDFQE